MVSFSGPAGLEGGVFPTFGRTLRTMVAPAIGLVVVLAAAIVGIVLAARHRKSRQRT